MKVSDFDFKLPDELIARFPVAERSSSRLLHVDARSGALSHHHFYDLPDFLESRDLLVFNNTRVIPARMFGQKESGGKVEILLERVLDDQCALAQVRASKSPKEGVKIRIEGTHYDVQVAGREGEFFILKFPPPGPAQIAKEAGHMPLPPYIDRQDEPIDAERYQTVYAKREGAVAAPTAGLHFDDRVMSALDAKGVAKTEVTLHVGAGTFQPIRVDQVEDHKMHREYVEVGRDVCDAVDLCRQQQGRVIAVGTTSVRCLESASAGGGLQEYQGDTDIFIYPGYTFQAVDAMVTNFHLPGSSLMMLVSAFAGKDLIRAAYEEAIRESYRFFSYGDAMFITR